MTLIPHCHTAGAVCAAMMLLGLSAVDAAAQSPQFAVQPDIGSEQWLLAESAEESGRSVTSGPAAYQRVQTLMPTLEGPNDTSSQEVRFGHSVSVDRNWVLVGMPDRRNFANALAGGVFFFERAVSPQWQLNRRLLVEDQWDYAYRCGRSVAMLARPGRSEPWVGNERARTGVLGCPAGQGNEGYAFIETQTSNPNFMSWGNFGVTAGGIGDRCGSSVAVAGTGRVGETFMASGCPGRSTAPNTGARGEVTILRYVGTQQPGMIVNDRWELDTILSYDSPAVPPTGSAWNFGLSVAMHRSDAGLLRVAVGMPGIGGDAGRVLVFERSGTGSFSEVARLTRPGGDQIDAQFGFSVAIDGNHLVVGAPGERGTLDSDGRVHTYARNAFTGFWQLATTINPSGIFSNQDGSRFGHAVALSANELWIGQPHWRNDAGNARGRALRYTRSGGGLSPVVYTFRQSFSDGGISSFNDGEFGWSVSVDASTGSAAIGYPRSGNLANPGRRWGSAWAMRVDRIHANGFGCASNCP